MVVYVNGYFMSRGVGRPLFTDGSGESLIATAAAADIYAEALDFLIQRGKRNHEALGGFGLVPAGAFQHVNNDTPLDLVHDLKEGRLRVIGGRARTGFTRERREKLRELQAHAANYFLAANTFRQQVHVHALLRGEDNGAFDNVFQLAHIAGPVVVHQELESARRELPQRLGVLEAIALEEMREEHRHILAAVAQWRKLQMNDVEAVEQVLTETAFANEREEIDVRGGDDADVHFDLFGAAETHEFAFLNNAQELGLRFGTDGGDFVEKDGALIGDFEETLFGSDGAGEGAFDVSEELRFEKVHGDRAGIHGHKGFVGASGGGVNRLGDELLARTALAANEDGGARRSHLGNEVQERLHLVALADDAGKTETLLEGALELDVFVAKAARLHSLSDLRQKFVVGPRLGDVIHRAVFERGPRHFNRAVGGNEHDGKLRIAAVNLFQDVQTVAVRQADVQQQEIERMLFELGKAGFAGLRAGDAVTFAL